MIYVRPDFYDSFNCKAEKCIHSCCVGWEIDIDDDTAKLYSSAGGELGEELAANISYEGGAHFIMRTDGRCPFLRQNGLCRIITELGEDALCDICSEHPRFYNCFDGREEAGLGLCCEEAVRLLTLSDEPLTLVQDDDGGEERRDPFKERLAKIRKDIFDVLGDRSRSLDSRIEDAAALVGATERPFDAALYARFLSGLENMEAGWPRLLAVLRPGTSVPDVNDDRYERILEYFIYRHFIRADSMEQAKALLLFCIASMRLIRALDAAGAADSGEILRMYSAEIEYSDENISLICSGFI